MSESSSDIQGDAPRDAVVERATRRAIPAWFTEAKFGMFIHWGIFSQLAQGEQVLFRDHMPMDEYRALADTFSPHAFDPAAWARTASEGGMRYAMLTTKLHDGFCLWDTRTTRYSGAATGAKRDYVEQYVNAFRDAGLKVGFYFSLADWAVPAYFRGPDADAAAFDDFIAMTHAQVRELCSNYGTIDVLWFDGIWPYTADNWRSEELVAMVRRLQPNIIVNDRAGVPGDITTPEQSIPEQQFKPAGPWESCITSTEHFWGYHAHAPWKTPAETIRILSKVVEVGGNLLYNVGPKPDGSLPDQFQHIMKQVGGWLDINGEAIYGTTQTICDTHTFGLMTCKPGRVYLHLLYWPGNTLTLAGLRNKVNKVSFLADGRRLEFEQTDTHVRITGLPNTAPDAANTVIALDVEGTPVSYPWALERIWFGALDATRDRARAAAARHANWSAGLPI